MDDTFLSLKGRAQKSPSNYFSSSRQAYRVPILNHLGRIYSTKSCNGIMLPSFAALLKYKGQFKDSCNVAVETSVITETNKRCNHPPPPSCSSQTSPVVISISQVVIISIFIQGKKKRVYLSDEYMHKAALFNSKPNTGSFKNLSCQ